MDYLDPVRALIDGVDGAVLSVLARTEQPLTLRQVAARAGASHPQVARHVQRFEELGLVERRIVGRGHLVQLTRSAAAEWVRSLTRLSATVIEHMRAAAEPIVPAPACIVVFGSFARGTAGPASDIDVLIVAPPGRSTDDSWLAQVRAWSDEVAAFAANPVSELVWDERDVPAKRGTRLWKEILTDGSLVAGSPLDELGGRRRRGGST